jgi:hypothetical protein
MDNHLTPYPVLIGRPAENTEAIHTYDATDYAEALTMAERAFAGIEDVLIAIPADAYDLARAEGIAFNEADGMLV